MLKSYLKISFRNIFKFKFFSIINILGLAIGMAVCLLMLMYVINEISFEQFHQKKDNIYRVALEWTSGQMTTKHAGAIPALAPVLNKQFPEVEIAIRIRPDFDGVLTNRLNEKIKEQNLFFAEQGIFDIFSFNLVQGNKKTALSAPYSMVLSQSQALKYFGDTNPLGLTILFDDHPVKITGIIEDVPATTHFKPEFLVSYSTIEASGQSFEQPWQTWGDDFTYILVRDNININSLTQKMADLLTENSDAWFASMMNFTLQPLTDIHWDSETRGDIGRKSNILYIYIFLSAAIFVLIIACFNFMNLSTARYLDRKKEVSIRKVIGAGKSQLVKQFLIESFVITMFAIFLGVVIFELLHNALYTYLDAEIVFNTIHFKYLSGIVVGMIFCVGLFAGGYPALFLAKFKPVEIMKNGTSGSQEKLSFRKTFVVAQFAISIILILGTMIINQQLDFMKNSDLGFEKEDVVLINFPFGNKEVKQKYETLRDELLINPNITSVSGAYTVPGTNSRQSISVIQSSSLSENAVNMQALPADYGYVSTLGLKLIEGRDFSNKFSLDDRESVILNQSAVKALELENPLGTKLKIPNNNRGDVTVIGIIKDFHIQSLHNKINPLLIYINPDMFLLSALKIKPQSEKATIAYAKKTMAKILPDLEFNYKYLRDSYNNLYLTEEKTGRLLSIFTGLALLVSCLGILGLASFSTNKRIKEIGIRKVLGASAGSITLLLSKQFTKWVILANIFAWPAAYYLIDKWLQNFAYRTTIDWWLFFLAAGLALMIAIITISTQTIKVAVANPVISLRHE